jgi:stage V sporulation protein B
MLNGITIRKHLGYKQEVFRTFVLPSISAFWMGLVTAGVYYGMDALVDVLGAAMEMPVSDFTCNIICLIPSLLAAVIVYFMLVIKLGALNQNELKAMPKGHLLLKIAGKLHLIHI